MSEEKSPDAYALKSAARPTVPPPDLPYRPPVPKTYRPNIALIGCGGISAAHLDAYLKQGFAVTWLCDAHLERAEKRRDEFFPEARVTTDPADVLADDSVEVVDLAQHPGPRLPVMESALLAGKHVLSQKPFVHSLEDGERLCDLAGEMGVKLAVNQNGRWAPHLAYIREAVRAGILGDLTSAHVRIHWDHTWVRGTSFERMRDLIFYDFGVHWFDFVTSLVGKRATSVFATRTFAPGQTVEPPMLAQALIELQGGGQTSLVFDAHVPHGSLDTTFVSGTLGSIRSTGPDLGTQTVTLCLESGDATPELRGTWFNDGFAGTMGELLCAVEENRHPLNSARGNLDSLGLCFAALASANDGRLKKVGSVRSLPPGSVL